MTDRIDHAAMSLRAMSQTLNYRETDENVGALVSMAAAQTHATLALVEQQRIRNLIALADARQEDSDLRDMCAEAMYGLIKYVQVDADDEYATLRPDIAAALGIGADHE